MTIKILKETQKQLEKERKAKEQLQLRKIKEDNQRILREKKREESKKAKEERLAQEKVKRALQKQINTNQLGFTETLKPIQSIQSIQPTNTNICQNILINGSKTNTSYFYPSELKKITKVKMIPSTVKKGGKNYNKRNTFKKYKQKHNKTKKMYKKN